LATDGRNYSSIKNAFLYREKMVEGCSCTNTATGTASLDPESDPTLRKGDIVVTRDGPKVFTGDGRLPHKPNEFVPAAAYKGLPMAVRQQLSAMRIAEEPAPQPVGPQEPRPSAVPPSPAPSQPLGPHASLSYMPVARGPVAEAFSTFR
jgi:hypothetical protein